ncbi:MAG: GIY-YIG nuclease family protein [Candidatus Limnocylindrales bacterium]
MSVAGAKRTFSERSIAFVPDRSGVYSLHSKSKTVYIGESGQLQTRLLQHLTGRGTPGCETADQYKYELVSGEKARKSREAALLREYRAMHRRLPRFNTQAPA